ncbi:hypothetical protein HII36_50315 [Nonomuraea sp. NN258]|uniref:hypothetical protein n=1 Tax=Nonomuraea antri TaxID=2730852 RepID=UPI001569CF7B|nr:hypothetical protein [Nonomuraea antri]NRQ39971.1 hypothetical protein [Nonomuraea antri]
MSASRWFATAFLTVFCAILVYGYGLWSGWFLQLVPTSEFCVSKPLDDPATSWSLFPLRHLCHWRDGTSSDLVPGYINPLIYLSIVGVVIEIVMGVRAIARRRKLLAE